MRDGFPLSGPTRIYPKTPFGFLTHQDILVPEMYGQQVCLDRWQEEGLSSFSNTTYVNAIASSFALCRAKAEVTMVSMMSLLEL